MRVLAQCAGGWTTLPDSQHPESSGMRVSLATGVDAALPGLRTPNMRCGPGRRMILHAQAAGSDCDGTSADLQHALLPMVQARAQVDGVAYLQVMPAAVEERVRRHDRFDRALLATA